MTQVSKVFTFNSRKTYLEFRAEWKAEYKQVSADIREDKNAIKNSQRESGQTPPQIYSRLSRSQRRANEMLELLIEAKKLAQQQYLEHKKEKELVYN